MKRKHRRGGSRYAQKRLAAEQDLRKKRGEAVPNVGPPPRVNMETGPTRPQAKAVTPAKPALVVTITIPLLEWDRTLSYSDMKVFEECELQYRFRKERRRKAPRELHQIVGDLTHKGAAEENPEAREAKLQDEIARLPVEKRVEAEKIVRELIANADELDDDNVEEQQKDRVLLTCKAPDPNWTLVAKPDETGMVDNEQQGPQQKVLQLVELKTAWRLKSKHKDQVFFAGTVAQIGKVLDYQGPIRLVIRLLRAKEEKVFWYSRSATERNLRRIGSVIRRIEQAVATNNFKANTGDHCTGCPYRNICEPFKAWSEAQQAQTSKDSDRQAGRGFVRHPYQRRGLPRASGQ